MNYDIFWGEYEGLHYSIEKFLGDPVEMDIYSVVVKTLPVEKAFIQLILHNYKEMNSLYHLSYHNCICTHIFMDIYDMLYNNREILTTKKYILYAKNIRWGAICSICFIILIKYLVILS